MDHQQLSFNGAPSEYGNYYLIAQIDDLLLEDGIHSDNSASIPVTITDGGEFSGLIAHWSFDEGLMSVGKEYQVLVSGRVQTEQNLPGHILTLRDRNIFTPDQEKFWPSQDNYAWHRRKAFRR